MELGMSESDRLPGVRQSDSEKAVEPAASEEAGFGGSKLKDAQLGYLDDHNRVELSEQEVRKAATGAVVCLVAAGIASFLPGSASVTQGSFDIFGTTTQEITVARDLLASLVDIARSAAWPLAVIGAFGLLLDAYLAVRPHQPIVWSYVCVGQMLLGYISGTVLVAIFLIVLANIVVGLLAAAAVAIMAIAVIAVALAIVGAFARA